MTQRNDTNQKENRNGQKCIQREQNITIQIGNQHVKVRIVKCVYSLPLYGSEIWAKENKTVRKTLEMWMYRKQDVKDMWIYRKIDYLRNVDIQKDRLYRKYEYAEKQVV